MGGIEIYQNIYIKEQQWINRLMDVEFRGRDILLKQFSKAKIIYTVTNWALPLRRQQDFTLPKSLCKELKTKA